MQAKAESRHVEADAREAAVSKREGDVKRAGDTLAADIASHELAKANLQASIAATNALAAKLAARKKKLDEATKDIGDANA